MKKIIIYCLFLIIALTNVVLANENPSKILTKLQKRYDGIKDATITFKQDVIFGVTKSEQSFAGTLLMKKGNRYRIELEDQVIATDGLSVWSYSKSSNQVLIDKYRDNPRSLSPDKLLVNIPEDYTVTILGKEKFGKKETVILKMIPNDKVSNLKWIKVWVDESDYLMYKVQVFDVSENLMTYTVENIKINSGLADTQFQFSIPSDAEVIDLR